MQGCEITKLQDAEICDVCGGMSKGILGGGLVIMGGSMAAIGVLGFVASEIASTVYTFKANKALHDGALLSCDASSDAAKRAKIAALSFVGGAAVGGILFTTGKKICVGEVAGKAGSAIPPIITGLGRLVSIPVPMVDSMFSNNSGNDRTN